MPAPGARACHRGWSKEAECGSSHNDLAGTVWLHKPSSIRSCSFQGKSLHEVSAGVQLLRRSGVLKTFKSGMHGRPPPEISSATGIFRPTPTARAWTFTSTDGLKQKRVNYGLSLTCCRPKGLYVQVQTHRYNRRLGSQGSAGTSLRTFSCAPHPHSPSPVPVSLGCRDSCVKFICKVSRGGRTCKTLGHIYIFFFSRSYRTALPASTLSERVPSMRVSVAGQRLLHQKRSPKGSET